jgi:hypothetical protein
MLAFNLEFVAARVDAETRAAVDDARAGLGKIIEITQGIHRLSDSRSRLPVAKPTAAK